MTVLDDAILKVVASLIWTDGEINQNVFAAQISGGGGPYADLDVVADALTWVETMYANLVGRLSDEIDGSQIQVYKYDSVGDDFDEVGSNSWVFNPTTAGNHLPRGDAGLCLMGTTDPDVQGKKYIPALTIDSLVDGLYSAGYLITALAFAEDWNDSFVGSASAANWTPGVWSPTNKDIFLKVDNFAVTTIPAYQRRRKNNVGV